MSLDIRDVYKKKKQEETDTEESESSVSIRDIYKKKNAQNAAWEIEDRTNKWIADYNKLVGDYNTRRVGNKTGYRGDATDYFNSLTTQITGFNTEAEDILALMNRYGDYLNEEWMKSITNMLSATSQSRRDMGSMVMNAYDDQRFWSQWESEDEYNAAVAASAEWEKTKAKYDAYDADAGAAKIERLKYYADRAKELEAIIAGNATGSTPDELRASQGAKNKAFMDLQNLYAEYDKEFGVRNPTDMSGIYREDSTPSFSLANNMTASNIFANDAPRVDFEALLNQAEAYDTLARRYQNKVELANAPKQAEDYSTGVIQGKILAPINIDNVKFDVSTVAHSTVTSYIPTEIEAARIALTLKEQGYNGDNYNFHDVRQIVLGERAQGSTGFSDGLVQKYLLGMTDEQFDNLAYYLYRDDQEGTNKAEQYISSIAEDVNQKKGNYDFESSALKDSVILQKLYFIPAGLDSFVTGIDDLTTDEYTPPSPVQYTSGRVNEALADNGWKYYDKNTGQWETLKILGKSTSQWFYEANTTVANMAPSLLASAAVEMMMPTVGEGAVVAGFLLKNVPKMIATGATLGASAAGHARNEMLELGYSKEIADNYGLLVGASETLLETFLGSIPGLSAGDGIFSSLGEKAIKAIGAVDNVLAKAAITLAKLGIKWTANGLDEAMEEDIQLVLETWFKEQVTGADFDDPSIEEHLYSALLGYLTGAGFSVGGSAVNAIGDVGNSISVGKNYKSDYGAEGVNALVSHGIEYNGTAAQKQAQKLQGKLDKGKKVSNYSVGRLYSSMSEAQISTSVQMRLTSEGVSETEARKLGNTVTDIIAGREVRNSKISDVIKNSAARTILNESIGAKIGASASVSDVKAAIKSYQEVAKSAKGTTAQNTGESASALKNSGDGATFSMQKNADGRFDVVGEAKGESHVIASFKSQKQAQAAVYAMTLGMRSAGLKGLVTIAESLPEGVSLGDAALVFNAIYNQGKSGKAMSAVKNMNLLSLEQRQYAYQNGIVDGLLEKSQKQERLETEWDVDEIVDKTDAKSKKITPDMSDAERYEILKDKEIVVQSSQDSDSESVEDYSSYVEELEKTNSRAKSKVEGIIRDLADKLGILNVSKSSPAIEIDFTFSKNNGLKKSLSRQLDYGGGYADFAKALINFDVVLENAILIEEHTDKYKGKEREDPHLEKVYVLFSAFKDGRFIIPVQLEIKKSSDVGGILYVNVAMTKIEADVLESTSDENTVTHSLVSASTYSIADIFKNVNTADKHFLKYLPDGFLSEEQIKAKQEALSEDKRRIDAMPNKEQGRKETITPVKNLTKEQKDVVEAGRRLGREVVIADIKLGKKNIDGLWDGKIIYINPNPTSGNPMFTLLKHELTHFTQISEKYETFSFAVTDSKVFSKWLRDKGFKNSQEYIAKIISDQKKVGKNWDNADGREKARREMVANFVGDVLFAEDGALERFVNALSPDHKRTFGELVRDFIAWIKKKLGTLSEIEMLERQYAKLFKDAKKAEARSTAKDEGGQYAFNDSLGQQLDDWIQGGGKKYGSYNGEYFELGTTPDILVKHGAKKVPVIMSDDCVAKVTGMKNDSGHNIAINEIAKLPSQLNDPILLFKGSYANSFVALTEIVDKQGHDVVVAIHINKFEKRTKITKIASLYSKTDDYGNNKIVRYVQNQINQGNLVDASIIKAPNWFTIRGLQLPKMVQTILDANNSISQKSNLSTGSLKKTSETDDSQYSYTPAGVNGVDNYTEEQYNSFGWTSYSGTLIPSQIDDLYSKIQEKKSLKSFPQSANGEAIIAVNPHPQSSLEVDNTLVFVKGTKKSFDIIRVLVIDLYSETDIFELEELIYEAEQRPWSRARSIVANMFESELVREFRRRDFSSYQEYTAASEQRSRGREGEGDNRDNQQQPRRENDNGKSKSDEVSDYSYTPSKEETIDELFKQYKEGAITEEEFKERIVSGKSKSDPISVAQMEEKAADTTPDIPRRQGKVKGDGERDTIIAKGKASIFSEEFKKEVETDEFIQKYKTITNEETLKMAAEELDREGDEGVQNWLALNPVRASVVDIVKGFILLDRYRRLGNVEGQVRVAQKISDMGTAAGQSVQSFTILRRLDSAAMLAYSQKSMDSAFQTMAKGKTEAWLKKYADRFKLTDEDIEYIFNRTILATTLPDGRDKDILIAQIAQRLQDKLPPERGQSAKALQRISMLLNPKTIIRNVVGNISIAPVHWVSDWVGTAVDKAISTKTGVRTTSAISNVKENAKAFGRGASEAYVDWREKINTQVKLDRFDLDKAQGKSFDEHGKLRRLAQALNAMDRLTSFALAVGDRPFYEYWFMRSINAQVRANKVDTPTAEMIEIATQEALQRTWQDDNKFSQFVSGLKRGMNTINLLGYGVGDVTIKFTKTPANIAKAIYDLSPVGFVSAARAAVNLNNAVKSGKGVAMAQKNFVKSFSNAVAGTLLYVMMAALFNAGRLAGKSDEDKDVAAFEKWVQGIPAYSFKLGGKWFSYEWMQPIGSVAAIVSDYMKAEDAGAGPWDSIVMALKSGGNVFMEQSFLQSFQRLFSADSFLDGVWDMVASDPSAWIPQTFSQFANLFDDERRVTYDKANPTESILNAIKYKIPGLRNTLTKDVDVFGRDVPNSQANVGNAFFNPANTYVDTSDKVTDHVYGLYKELGSKGMIPAKAPYSITVDGKSIPLSAEERANYQRIMGGVSYKIIAGLLDSEIYNSYSSAEKEIIIKDVYSYAKKVADASYNTEITFEMINASHPYILRDDFNDMTDEQKKETYRSGVLSSYSDILETDEKGVIAYFETKATKHAVLGATRAYDADKVNELLEAAKTNIERYSSDDEVAAENVKAFNQDVKSSLTKWWKVQYRLASLEDNSSEMERIENMLVAIGLYGNRSEVRKKLKQWLEDQDEW